MTPPPGSPSAIYRGCECGYLENNGGKGWRTDDDQPPAYVIAEGCPVHDREEEKP